MKRSIFSLATFLIIFILCVAALPMMSCGKSKTAADVIQPVKSYFEELDGVEVVAPSMGSIENGPGTILTWKVLGPNQEGFVEYSWALAKNTEDLKKALAFFEPGQSWNSEEYIFLPVNSTALEVHRELGLQVPQSIYDEDGMVRIREIVLEGKLPEGGFVEKFDKFYGD